MSDKDKPEPVGAKAKTPESKPDGKPQAKSEPVGVGNFDKWKLVSSYEDGEYRIVTRAYAIADHGCVIQTKVEQRNSIDVSVTFAPGVGLSAEDESGACRFCRG